MARTIQAIQQQIFDNIAADENLQELNSTSKVAIYRLFAFIVSYCAWLLETLFDTGKAEIATLIEQDKAHRPSWYKKKALAFQFGFDLIFDTDLYDNTGYTDDQIEDSKIIKYCAVPKSKGQKAIKIATEVGGVLAPVTELQKTAFEAYMDEISDWGVDYVVVNQLPDVLLLNFDVYIDALVLDSNGMSILNGNYPVQEAILEFMKELPFNGELILFDLETKIKKVPGVTIPNIVNAESQTIDVATGNYLPAQPITVKTIPESGYFTVPNFNNVRYVVQN